MSPLQKALTYLQSLQAEDGHFEGLLSSSMYPTCSYALLQHLQGRPIPEDLIEWILLQQGEDGLWRLDASSITDPEATCFARLVLSVAAQTRPELEESLQQFPPLESQLWIIKLFEALCGYRAWQTLMPPPAVKLLMDVVQQLMPLMPRVLLRRAKPPTQFAPPPDIFRSPAFRKLFIAEQHTIVPLAILIELNTRRRSRLLADLVDWLLTHRMTDGSWFRVHFITAISTMALLAAHDAGLTDAPLQPGLGWLEATHNPDGGCREAINLSVWDTALSTLAILEAGGKPEQLQSAGEWLLAHQNPDGGWPFSGMPGGELPSDADDTALATLALLRLGHHVGHTTLQKALRWLRSHQGRDGSWSTYVPGAGDVGCVSVTAHAMEACIEAGGLEAEVGKAARWLTRTQQADGSWTDLWLAYRTYGTANAIMAFMQTGAHPEAVQRGVRWLESAQQADGGWGEDIRGNVSSSTSEQTAWSTRALRLVDPNSKAAQRGIEWIRAAQRPDGSWEPACVGIYWEVIGGYADPIYASVFPLLALASERDESGRTWPLVEDE